VPPTGQVVDSASVPGLGLGGPYPPGCQGGGLGEDGGLRRLTARPAAARASTTRSTAPIPTGTHGGTLVFAALLRGAAAGDADDVGVGGALPTVTRNDG
jgi:hypothetical protein